MFFWIINRNTDHIKLYLSKNKNETRIEKTKDIPIRDNATQIEGFTQ